jgi:hypothetical protein
MSKFQKISGQDIQPIVFREDLVKVIKNKTGEELFVRIRDLYASLEGNENTDVIFLEEDGDGVTPPPFSPNRTTVVIYENGVVWKFLPSSGWVYQGQLNAGSSGQGGSVLLEYEGTVNLNQSWNFGLPAKKISTEAGTVSHSGVHKWHFSAIDRHDNVLGDEAATLKFWDELIGASSIGNVFIKVYNRSDTSQYVFLVVKQPMVKANPSIGNTTFDLRVEAQVLTYNNVVNNTIDNASAAFLIGNAKDVVRNNTDSFNSFEKVNNVVTLSRSEYIALGSGRDANTLFLIPCST